MKLAFGPSSWNYPGWHGLVFNKKYRRRQSGEIPGIGAEHVIADRQCLKEVVAYPWFQTACADYAFYRFPDDMAKTIETDVSFLTPQFPLAFKATRTITEFWKYDNRQRLKNPMFLNAALFQRRFLHPILAMVGPDLVRVVMLEFSPFDELDLPADRFAERLDDFFSQLAEPRLPLACELRSPHLLTQDYLTVLHKHRVGHVFNHWVKMPSPRDQLEALGGTTAHSVCRVLTPLGMAYMKAKAQFYPYDSLKRPDDGMIASTIDVIHTAFDNEDLVSVYVNNRAEGNAIATIRRLIDRLKPSARESLTMTEQPETKVASEKPQLDLF